MNAKHYVKYLVRLALGLSVLVGSLPAPRPAEAGWRSLTGKLPNYTDVYAPQFSPDSQYLVYLADVEQDERRELYSVALAGGQPHKLNLPLASNGDVYYARVTPDSQYVIFTAVGEGSSLPNLYRVPIAGGEAVQLNVGPGAGYNVQGFRIDPDNVYVVYRAERYVQDQLEIFSVPILGGEAVRLNPDLVPTGDVIEFEIDPFMNRVVYRGDQEVKNLMGLYGVPIGGGTAVPLGPDNAYIHSFALNPQLQFVVYLAQPQNSSQLRLYGNATTGGLLIPLSAYIASDENVMGFRITPNGANVVFNVVKGSPPPALGNLYTVLIGGGEPIPLTAFAPGEGVLLGDYQVSPDSQRVVYAAYFDNHRYILLQSMAVNGTSGGTFFGTWQGENPNSFQISPDSQAVVFDTAPSLDTYWSPITGGLGAPFAKTFYTSFLPDGSRLLAAMPNADGNTDLFSLAPEGTDPRNLSRLLDNDYLTEIIVSPDSHWIVYGVSDTQTGRLELRVSDGGLAQYQLFLPQIAR